jgi:hypothetical protein
MAYLEHYFAFTRKKLRTAMKNSFSLSAVSAEIRANDHPDTKKKNAVSHKQTGYTAKIMSGFQTPVTWGANTHMTTSVLVLSSEIQTVSLTQVARASHLNLMDSSFDYVFCAISTMFYCTAENTDRVPVQREYGVRPPDEKSVAVCKRRSAWWRRFGSNMEHFLRHV